MSPKFNINRPPISDEEINKHKNFDQLLETFKQQSLKKAQGDESWWKNKSIRYSTIIAGITVVCVVSYLSLTNSKKQNNTKHETLITQNTNTTKSLSTQKYVQPPSDKLKSKYSTYKVNAAKGAELKHSTRSKINIPKNSFVDKNGKDIVGEVTIEYKEYHDMGDIIAGGIPMAYDSAGKKYNLQSAGMFDIRGSQNGEPVFIKPDKTLDIELVSASTEQKFNQYYLDTIQKNWQYIKRDKADPIKASSLEHKNETAVLNNAKTEKLINEIEKIIPRKIDSVGVVYKHKTEKLNRPKEPNKPMQAHTERPNFKLEGSNEEFPELAAFNNVVFEVGPENKNCSTDLQEITWSDVKISQGPVIGKNYILSLSYRNRKEKLIVYPVLSGKDFEKANTLYTAKLEEYDRLLEKRNNDEKRLLAEMEAKQATYMAEQKRKQEELETERAKLAAKYNVVAQNELASNFNTISAPVKATRLFSISKFGIFNSDCPHAMAQGNTVSPVFLLSASGKPFRPDLVYLIDHSNQTVYSFSQNDGFRFTYDPMKIYSLCVFAKNKMFVCNKENYQETIDKAGNKFMITPLPDQQDNLIDFKKALEL